MPVRISDENPKILRFLESHQVGILATVSQLGLPNASTIYFTTDPDFTVHFITKEQTAKHDNIRANPHVALAVFEASSQTTVQLTGTAHEVKDTEQLMTVFVKILAITKATSGDHKPPMAKIEAGDYVLYRIEPKTVRLAEFVKAEYPPVDQLFETIIKPDGVLE